MAPLPQPNPIDLGLLPRGMPIDHVRTSSEYCFLCDAHTQQHLFKLIHSYHLGFGVPAIVKPFVNRSTTKGKTGRRQHYSVCTMCSMAWAADERTRQLVLDLEFSGNTAADRACREMWSTLRCEGMASTETQIDALIERVNSEFSRRHPERWAQLESEQNAALIDATLSVMEDNSGTAFTPLERENAHSELMEALGDQGVSDERQAQSHSSAWMQQLKEIGRLRDDGLLTEDEFQAEKTRILQDKDKA